jgi:hypothetical protein
VNQINNMLGISVSASVTDQGLVIKDESGGTGNLAVQDLNNGHAAKDLGIAGTSSTGSITGSNINYISATTSLSQLNDGNGVAAIGGTKNDFAVTLSDGSVINVGLNGATTVGDVITAINQAGGPNLSASINSAGNGISLTDNSGGGGTMSIAAENGSEAAADLGLTGPASGNTINGRPLMAGLDSEAPGFRWERFRFRIDRGIPATSIFPARPRCGILSTTSIPIRLASAYPRR